MTTITPQQALQRTIEHREIFFDEMLSLMRQIMAGEVSPVMTAAILTGLRVKKETIGEITAAATVMREMATRVEVKPPHAHFLDVVGTGGDNSYTFNISTTTIFVAAAAGARVAKHGGRGVSSKSGAADVIEALGVNLELTPAQVADCIEATGIGFMYAPVYHTAMKNVGPVRREMGVRTIFNILGPLTNPADAPNILMGVFHPDLVGIQVRALQRLGAEHAVVVYGRDGMDEVSLGAATMVGEYKDGAGIGAAPRDRFVGKAGPGEDAGAVGGAEVFDGEGGGVGPDDVLRAGGDFAEAGEGEAHRSWDRVTKAGEVEVEARRR